MKVLRATYLISSPDVAGCPKPDRPEFAFIGRSNVGKSSLINMLCGHDKLAKTSASPGKTQLINHFQVDSEWPDGHRAASYWVDLPGYGFAKVSLSSRRRWEQMTEHYMRKRENLAMVFLLLDARHSAQKVDLEFMERLRKWKVPFTIIFTKTDKENQRTISAHVQDVMTKMRETWMFLPPYFLSSATKKSGRDKILSYIGEMQREAESDPIS